MNEVSDSSNNFMEENGSGGSDSDANTDDLPEYYQPISAGEEASDSDDGDSQFHRLPNGYSNGVSSLDLSDGDDDDDETKRSEEEEAAANAAIRRAMRDDESRRNAPLTEENATRVMEAMRGVTFSGVAPLWAGRVPEEQWINQLRRLREPQTTPRD